MRFYVNAGYAQPAGGTIGRQTSIWRWDGQSPMLLWIGFHHAMIAQELGVEFDGRVFTIGEKQYFRSFFVCGSCEGRQMAHRLRLTATGVQDLGLTSLTPELDLVDELFWRLAEGRSTADIASTAVSQYLRPRILEEKRRSREIASDYFSTGMLMDPSVTTEGHLKRLQLGLVSDLGKLIFTIQQKATRSCPSDSRRASCR